ncbi:acyl-CoA synthetase (NDP forming) [Rhodoligotrophos appendicifer]|uniref:acetate--CoA ligase family protein n=1 Tax=Rhodoligotrophos appendicifer TaxID=987056 RepID=UPI001186BB40|nr:CoA-binding protein [Rhodoligotrophos appendicifer]
MHGAGLNPIPSANTRPLAANALQAAFHAKSVAIIGASTDPRKLGHLVLKMLVESGFEGQVYPVNKSADEVLGHRCYARLTDIEGPVEVAVVIVPSEHLIASLNDCAVKEIKLVAAITSGFAEAGEPGRVLQEQLVEALRTAPYRLLGPNCEGYVVPSTKTFVTFSLMTLGLKPGSIAIVAQSGAVSGAIAHRLNRMGVGIRTLISTGNETDITCTDALEWLAEDEGANTIVCYLEQIRDADRFVEVARRLRGRKGIVIEKPGRGRAAAEAVGTHTGAIAGDDKVVDGVFEELSIVRAPDLTAAIDAGAALSLGKTLGGRNVGIISIAGGLAVEASDVFEAGGFEVPRFADGLQQEIRKSLPYFAATRNPVDLTGAALSSPGMFKNVIELTLADEGIDAVIVIITFAKHEEFAHVVMDAAAATDKPLLVVWTAPESLSPAPLAAFHARSFPVFDAPIRALTGLKAIARFSGVM